ncbi:hypothetical protein H9P43_009062 [Blastocladiella emersonii ATCC 22665]|nr:hypothetical protein H9P43_009062 [Blastocladiella emersonii ATCC 22665]
MRNTFLTLALTLLALSHAASAHYILTSPPTRGMQEEQMPTPPCGNFNTPQTPRSGWPVGKPIGITAYHTNANFTIYISLKPAPAAVSDFTPVTNTLLGKVGAQTVDAPFDKLSESAVKGLGLKSAGDLVGKEGTIMTVYDAGDGVLYQCGDVSFQAAGGSGGAAPGKSGAAGGFAGSAVVGLVAAAAGGAVMQLL